MFWIPRGWVPGYVEWVLSFPRAPLGSVSILIWEMACATVVQMVLAAAASALVLEMRGKARAGPTGGPTPARMQREDDKKQS